MKKIFKKAAALILCIAFVVLCLPFSVLAANGTTISFSKNTVAVGDSLKVTVKFSSSYKIFAAEAKISYDASLLELTSSSSEYNGGAGVLLIAPFSDSQTFTFKVLKPGKCTFQVYDALISDGEEEYNAQGSSASVSLIDKNQALSSNANLKSLRISAGTLSPEFSSDVTTYSITIGSNVSELTVSATTADSSAKVSVSGSKTMKTGKNQRVVTVTAPNGTTKSYTLNITKLSPEDSANNSSSATDSESTSSEQNPITNEVIINGDIYVIQNDFSSIKIPAGFSITEQTYSGKKYHVLKNATGSLSLFHLFCDANQHGGLFLYDPEKESFSEFTYISPSSGTYVVLTPDESVTIPEGFSKIMRTISGNEIEVFQMDSNSEYCLIYATGPSGYTGFYSYDLVEQTIQRYFSTGSVSDKEVVKPNLVSMILNDPTYRMILICSTAAIGLVLLVLIIVLIVRRKRDNREENYIDYFEEDETEENISFSIGNR